MAWFGDGLSSLSNLKGQLTSFTKEVLSDGIVEELDRPRELQEANERCVQLQELLNTKDAEISILRRQNCDLQKTVVELNSRTKEPVDVQDEETEAFFWDPPSTRARHPRAQNQPRPLQEQLAQASMKIRDLESELKRVQKLNSKDEIPEAHQRAEFLRARQDMMNRIIQLEEKSRGAERLGRRGGEEEATLAEDFRLVMSKLDSSQKLNLLRTALRALEAESADEADRTEKADCDEKLREHPGVRLSNEGPQERPEVFPEADGRRDTGFHKESLNNNGTLESRESLEKLSQLKEELEKKHRCLQNAYEQLYVDYNQSQERVSQLEALSSSSPPGTVETSSQQVQTIPSARQNREVQTELHGVEYSNGTNLADDRKLELEDSNRADRMDELMGRMKEILRNSCIDVEPGESIFEAVARQYVDAKWKKDLLERRVTELTRELKEMAEARDAAQLECEDMQTHVDTLILEIQDLKLNLPSIPEASEERVASLESETESLQEELKRLRVENAEVHRENSSLRKLLEGSSLPGDSDQGNPTGVLEESYSGMNDRAVEPRVQSKVDSPEGSLGDSPRRPSETSNETPEGFGEVKTHQNEDSRLSQRGEYPSRAADSSRNPEESVPKGESQLHEESDEADRWIGPGDAASDSSAAESFKEERLSLLARLEECNDKIDLLNTEKSLLEQEHAELKRESASRDAELKAALEKLDSVRERYKILEAEFSEVNAEAERLQAENEALQTVQITGTDLQGREDAEREVSRLTTELDSLLKERDGLRVELETLRCKEEELLKLEGDFIRVTDENSTLKSQITSLLQRPLPEVPPAAREPLPGPTGGSDHEKEQMMAILEERIRENAGLKKETERLMAEIVEMQKRVQQAKESNEESASMARQTIESLSHLVREKDTEITELKAILDQRPPAAADAAESEASETERELMKLITEKHNESLQYHSEVQRLSRLVTEQDSQIRQLVTEQETKSQLLTQRELDLAWLRNELQVTQGKLNSLAGSGITEGCCGIPEHSSQASELSNLTEKCSTLTEALLKEQSNFRLLRNQLTESQGKEANLARELERLRSHLVEMESSYTEEAVIAEETRKQLEGKLQQAEERIKNSSTVYTSASIRANQQVETLQQQIALIIQQRDDIQGRLSAAEDKVLSQTASLTNLQIVLEQFQRDKERDIQAATERIQARLSESYNRQEELTTEMAALKDQLSEAKECLQAASRLSEQLDRKSERIEQLSQEVERLTGLVNTADRRIEEARQSGEGKVDKFLMKNLLLGYFSSPAADKSSVVRVFATVLDFNESEREKAGLNHTDTNSWFSRVSNGSASVSKDQEASLSTAFIKFLESESRPKPQLPALPIQTSALQRPGHSRRSSSSSTQSTLLLTDVNLPTFPDFVPARNTGSILKEVLKDN